MFFVVTDEVPQGKTIMGRDEVDAGPGAAAELVEEVTRRGQAPREDLGRRSTLPEFADGIAKGIVPLRPSWREGTYLVSAKAYIPRLRDEFHGAQNGILADGFEKSTAIVKAVRFPCE